MAVRDSGRRVALITGVAGQDGTYLSQYLLGLGYNVHGIKRRSSSFNAHASIVFTMTRTSVRCLS